jgi:hypothetical protein
LFGEEEGAMNSVERFGGLSRRSAVLIGLTIVVRSFGVNPERRCRWRLLSKLCPACS